MNGQRTAGGTEVAHRNGGSTSFATNSGQAPDLLLAISTATATDRWWKQGVALTAKAACQSGHVVLRRLARPGGGPNGSTRIEQHRMKSLDRDTHPSKKYLQKT